jgi:hypothetical protein
MPNPKGVSKSHVTFNDHGPPRIFQTIGGAKTALRLWSEGHWGIETAWESTNEYGDGYYIQGLPKPLSKHKRDITQYEIVVIDLIIRSLP